MLKKVRSLFSSNQLAGAFARGSAGMFVAKIAGAGLGFLSQVLLARFMGADQYGIYTYVWTCVLIIGLLSTLGFRKVLVRFVASFRAEEKLGRLRQLLWRATKVVGMVSGAIGAVGATICFVFGARIGQDLAAVFSVGFFLVPLIALVHLRKEALNGLRCVVRGEILFQILRPLLLIVGVAALWYLCGPSVTALQVAWLTVAVLTVAYVTGTYWLRRNIPEEVWAKDSGGGNKAWVKTAFPYLLISSAAILQSNTDIIMTGAIVDPEAAGIYKASARVVGAVGFGLAAMRRIVSPITSELYTKGKMDRLQDVIGWTSFLGFIFAFSGALGLGLFGERVLGLFGPEFTKGYPVLLILLTSKVAFTFAGPTGMLMSMTGREWTASKVLGIGVAINVSANFLLIPIFGIVGAAFASLLSSVTWNTILVLVALKNLNINTTAIFAPMSIIYK